MNTHQLLALVGRIESLAAAKALSEEENHKLCTQIIGLHESLDDMRREIKALNEDLRHEQSVSDNLSKELSKLKNLISENPVTVQLPHQDESLVFKICLIKFVRQHAILGNGCKMGLKEAKEAVDAGAKITIPAAIAPDYEKLIREKGKA